MQKPISNEWHIDLSIWRTPKNASLHIKVQDINYDLLICQEFNYLFYGFKPSNILIYILCQIGHIFKFAVALGKPEILLCIAKFCFIVFLVFAVCLNLILSKRHSSSIKKFITKNICFISSSDVYKIPQGFCMNKFKHKEIFYLKKLYI